MNTKRVCFLLAVCWPLILAANIRGPLFQEQPAATNLGGAVSDIQVLSEELTFKCGKYTIDEIMSPCGVKAQYVVKSRHSRLLQLQFVLSENARQIRVQMAGKNLPIEIRQTPRIESDHRRDIQSAIVFFKGSIPQGQSTILVTYQQPLSFREYGYGYFSDGKFVHHLDYELWPLKEWQLAPDLK